MLFSLGEHYSLVSFGQEEGEGSRQRWLGIAKGIVLISNFPGAALVCVLCPLGLGGAALRDGPRGCKVGLLVPREGSGSAELLAMGILRGHS